ncbi:xyloglucanase precursor [mine drainage metagenome]|uniref:Xyloglucanase n=1 Tax=mine drainage metagenome TaxID=410659 RepID=A0A1J5Q640_9ZZZZ
MPWGPGPSGLAFNPANPNQLFTNGNQTVSTTTLSGNVTSSTIPNWTDQGVGLEELVANQILVAPVAGSVPLLASWDTAVFRTNGTNYATTSNFYPYNLAAGWSIDYASSNPNFIVLLADGSYAGGPQASSYSTNDGQTWTPLPTIPPGGSFGGNIAASTPNNFIFAGTGNQPYYTLDGGNTWNPVNLPGVSSYSNLLHTFSNARIVTADRVLANTFYLLDVGTGLFKTTNGGATWTLVNTSVNTLDPSYVMGTPQIESTPGVAGDLWIATGQNRGRNGSLLHSTDGGSTWTAIANVVEPMAIGFGAPAPGQSYPAIYMVGLVNGVYGIWQSINDAQSWTQLGPFANNSLDTVRTISGDPNVYGHGLRKESAMSLGYRICQQTLIIISRTTSSIYYPYFLRKKPSTAKKS